MDNSSGYTPGPWETHHRYVFGRRVREPDTPGFHLKSLIAKVQFDAILSKEQFDSSRNEKEQQANALLISTSPELYEAGKLLLEAFRELPDGFFYDIPMELQKKLTKGWVELESAIEKAEGREDV